MNYRVNKMVVASHQWRGYRKQIRTTKAFHSTMTVHPDSYAQELRDLTMHPRNTIGHPTLNQSSQIVSRSKSPLLSPPQTLHLFLSRLPSPLILGAPPSKLLLLPSASAAALKASTASASFVSTSSPASSIVSSELILGDLLLDIQLVGVLGTLLPLV